MSVPPPMPPRPPLPAPPGAAAFAAPYAPAPQGSFPPPAASPRGRGLGLLALLLALIAALPTTVLGAVATFEVGIGAGADLVTRAAYDQVDLSVLSPVRDWVLVAEVSFWTGTVVGVAAVVVGIVAIAARRGRGLAIGGTAVAVAGPAVFLVVTALAAALGIGLAAG